MADQQQNNIRLLTCLYDFQASDDDELSFRKDNVLILLDDTDTRRFYARQTGSKFDEGFVPRNYVSVHKISVEDCHEDEDNIRLLTCLHDFHASDADELSFRKDNVLILLDDTDTRRFYARHTGSKFDEGFVPRNYVSVHKISVEDCHEDEGVSIPDELENDPHTISLYDKALKEGTEIDNAIRVMIIGCHSQGKTSLVRRLLGQTLTGVETTDGIELKQCISGKLTWKEDTLVDPERDSCKRIAKIAMSYESINEKSTNENKNKTLPVDTVSNSVSLQKRSATSAIPGFGEGGSHVPNTSEDRNVRKESQNVPDMATGHSSAISIRPKYTNQLSKRESVYIFKTELRKSIPNIETENKISIWDFGGQYIYYATHQIFHSRQALYIFVFNLAAGLDVRVVDKDFPRKSETRSMRDYIKFWVNSVHSFVGSEDGKSPTIILVGTHRDELQDDAKADEYFEEIRKIFDTSTAKHHFYHETFAVSNVNPSTDQFADLRKTIIRVGKKQGKRKVPAKWILLEKTLKDERYRKIITFTELLRLDQLNEYPVQCDDGDGNSEDMKLFLKYHHARGTFCYFDDAKLSNYVVLDPQFLIDAFKCIITSEEFCKPRSWMREYWQTLCGEAILVPELLDEVWAMKHNGEDYLTFKDVLLQYLQRFRILSDVLKYDENCKGNAQATGKYIVPSLLKLSAEEATVECFLQGKSYSEVSLGYMFENDSLLPTFYQRILSAIVGQWPLMNFDEKLIVFDDTVACRLRHDHAGMLILKDNRLELIVVNMCPPANVASNVCDMFRRFVEMVTGEELYRLRDKESERKRTITHQTVRCLHKSHGCKGSKRVLELKDLDNFKLLPCPDNRSHCIKSENVRQDWFLRDIVSHRIPKRKLTTKEYSLLSMAIGWGWQQIGRQLGIDDIKIQHIEIEMKQTDMSIYNMLLEWDKQNADCATLDVLIEAISSCSSEAIGINWDKLNNLINGFQS